jgi:hypothetical protein
MTSPMVKRKREVRTRSAYQAHVLTILPAEAAGNVVDLTERKLRRIAKLHADEDIRKLAARMLHDYLRGSIAIAWEDGVVPVYCFLKL